MAIDLAATKLKVKQNWGSINAYADARPFKYVTLMRFFKLGLGDKTTHDLQTETQKIVAFLRSDGLLVE